MKRALLAAAVIILIGALTFAVYFFALKKHDDRGVSVPAAAVSIQTAPPAPASRSPRSRRLPGRRS